MMVARHLPSTSPPCSCFFWHLPQPPYIPHFSAPPVQAPSSRTSPQGSRLRRQWRLAIDEAPVPRGTAADPDL